MLTDFLRTRWLSWNLYRRKRGDSAALGRLYRLRDPWGLNSPVERFRFQETARIIRETIGDRLPSLFEIGCGEGLQTRYLAPLTERLLAIDPSMRAIARARAEGIANATFEPGDLLTYDCRDCFTLVTACEVVYYLDDLERVYQRLSHLAEVCIVTYYWGAYDRLDPFFRAKSVTTRTISHPSSEWRLVCWHSSGH